VQIASTYSEWVNLLDRFAEGDDSCISILEKSSFIVDAGTAIRFYTRIEETYRKRKKAWLENFQKSFELSNLKRIDDFEIILRNSKQNLIPLNRFVLLSSLPDDLKKVLSNDLNDFVLEIKSTLKNNMAKISDDRDKMLIMVSSFELPALQLRDIYSQNETNSNNVIHQFSGRKIIFK
jgi:hypothetical protein